MPYSFVYCTLPRVSFSTKYRQLSLIIVCLVVFRIEYYTGAAQRELCPARSTMQLKRSSSLITGLSTVSMKWPSDLALTSKHHQTYFASNSLLRPDSHFRDLVLGSRCRMAISIDKSTLQDTRSEKCSEHITSDSEAKPRSPYVPSSKSFKSPTTATIRASPQAGPFQTTMQNKERSRFSIALI